MLHKRKVINLSVGKKIKGSWVILREEEKYDLLFFCDLKRLMKNILCYFYIIFYTLYTSFIHGKNTPKYYLIQKISRLL